MARKKKSESTNPEDHADAEGSRMQSNSAVRADYQNNKFAEWYDLDKAVVEARETHLKPLTDARTKLRRDMKADLDMHQEDIKVAYAVYKRRREATEWDDQGESDRVHDSLLELFRNLQQGGQLDFMQALQDAPAEGDADVRPGFLRDREIEREAAGTA